MHQRGDVTTSHRSESLGAEVTSIASARYEAPALWA